MNQNKIKHRSNDAYENKRDLNKFSGKMVHLTIAKKLILSYLPIIIVTSGIFTIVGIQLISTRILTEAQDKVQHDLNSAREIYRGQMDHINDVIRFTADRFFLTDALLSNNIADAFDELVKVKTNEKLDILSLADANGVVIFRSNTGEFSSNTKNYDELISAVISQNKPVISTSIIPRAELLREAPHLAELTNITVLNNPRSRPLINPELTSGLMIKAAAPIFDYQNNLLGVLFGGILLNKNYEIVDVIKQTVFEDVKYNGKDLGTVTIFQDDVRISTNVKNNDGSRAIGTRVSEEVYNQVVLKGEPWIGRAYVVNDWYISAYEPIRDIHYQVIGILYVGILEQKYTNIKSQMILVFLSIALAGAAISSLISYYFSRKITVPINKLVLASRNIAQGNLSQSLEVTSSDELGELASTFNTMAANLIEREKKLKEFKSKVIESEKLAIIGQLAANVAHELNNPLVGIITYSHLLLEETPTSENSTEFLQKIVIQANRCKTIVRGLLDFARQRKPDKTLLNINNLIIQSVSLLENQSLFHNIKILQDLSELPMVIIDPSQIEQVFMNIILNAAEAITGIGELNISSRYDPNGNFVEVDFADSGSGISEENIENIFEPFFSTKDASHGVGLGLAISYGIIREHNGTISVKSRLGEGTTFTVRLPVSFHRNTVIFKEVIFMDRLDRTPRILIIDDEEVVLDSCAQILKKSNYLLSTAINGELGLQLLNEFKPDLVCVDLKMPGLSGFEVLNKIRVADPNIVAIVITGFSTVSSAIEAMKNGAYDFLPKPFTPDEFRHIIDRGIERRKLVLETIALKREKEMLKEHFAAVVSHELKSPLGAVQQNLYLLELEISEKLNESQKEIIERMKAKINDLINLIHTWLRVITVDVNKLKDNFKELLIETIISKSIENFQHQATMNDVIIVSSITNSQSCIYGDEGTLVEAIGNLLGNAIKFSRPGSQIKLISEKIDNQIVISVNDRGVGISSEDLPYIFEDFFTGESGLKKEKSSGLGLAITRRIIEAHNGSISVTSELSKGSTFTIKLPIIQP